LIMIGGSIAVETIGRQLLNDPDSPARYLGVEPVAETLPVQVA